MVSDPEVIIHYPVAGNKPDYEPTVIYQDDYFSFGTSHSTGYNANFMKNDVCWEDLTDNTYFSPNGNETFVEGHQCRVSFYITPNFGYAFYSDYDPELYSATVDPEDEMGDHAHHTTSYQLVSDGSGYCEYTFPALPTRPTITTQPKSVTVSEGKTAIFRVVATGADSYKWQYQKPGESTWTNVANNGTSATYSLTTAARHNGYKYRCKVTNAAGTVTSSTATLTIGAKPTITTQPKAKTVTAGAKATFKVVATDATSYKWQYQKPGSSTWTDVSNNGTSATYSLTTAARHNGYKYRCKVTNAAGTVTSSVATLTIGAKPTITTQPKAKTVTAGAKATFKVVAEGATGYKWQYQKPGSTTWTDVSNNGTSATYSLTTAARHNGYKYRCKVTNSAGTVYTSAVKLTVK